MLYTHDILQVKRGLRFWAENHTNIAKVREDGTKVPESVNPLTGKKSNKMHIFDSGNTAKDTNRYRIKAQTDLPDEAMERILAAARAFAGHSSIHPSTQTNTNSEAVESDDDLNALEYIAESDHDMDWAD